MTYFVGIDVGSASARAGVFDAGGVCLGAASAPIDQFRPAPAHVTQSSSQIWSAVARASREALAASAVDKAEVAGLGFDATCSLVLSDANGGPVPANPGEPAERDVVMWMDHRAASEAAEVDATGHPALRQVGGRISLEMQAPKLLWIKRNHPDAWRAASHFTDLPDWLTWRATGSRRRSLCSVVCKWMHTGTDWDESFWQAVGLGELADDGFARIGAEVAAPGSKIGKLTAGAADDLGLEVGTPVAASLIDAYSGALGTLGCAADLGGARMALIAGTSACHITLSEKPAFVPGVWGPYPGVLLSGMSANEAGQSAAGAFLDAVLARHAPVGREAVWPAVESLPAEAAARLHLLPDILGNRSPLADPGMRGALTGRGAELGEDVAAREALAAIQSLAYGTRHILEVLADHGVRVDTIVVSGGLATNASYVGAHAAATGCRILVPERDEPVLLGSAMLGAVAGGHQTDLRAASAAMSGPAREVETTEDTELHERKYRVFRHLLEFDIEARKIMEGKA